MTKTREKKTPPAPATAPTDPAELTAILMQTAERMQPMMIAFLQKMNWAEIGNTPIDPLNIRQAWAAFFEKLAQDPDRLAEMQVQYMKNWFTLWQESVKKFMGHPAHELYPPDKSDKRFKSPAWQDSAMFDFIKQSYLMTSRWMQQAVRETGGLDDATRHKLEFYTKQFVDALSPSNFLLTNPDVIQATLDTRGENLVRGFQNLLEDMERGKGHLKISTTDYDAFKLGENIATAPGDVVFRNDLIELIQYAPTTDDVYKVPLLIVPPWINKFYILDLRPDNSFIKWAVAQGHTVFVVSWVNPDTRLAQKTFADYMTDGIMAALDHIRAATAEDKCNVIGYCIGGTLLATTLAWLAARGDGGRIASATFFTTLIDFRESGDIRVFIDDAQLSQIENEMADRGVFDARNLKDTFSLLRANDLIWSFVVNNYLLGREPFPFDLLYWNDDSTNMPAAMHSFYLRNMYRDNKLVTPGALELAGTPIDLAQIKTPAYFLSTREDHIAPWTATYAATQLFSGPVTFTLSASGHVAGVINPPSAQKYAYWTAAQNPEKPDDWLATAKQHDGSWWPHWAEWVRAHAGDKTPARRPAQSLAPAPGTYVRMKAD